MEIYTPRNPRRNKRACFRKVTTRQIQRLLDELDEEGKRNFTHDIQTKENRLDLGAYVRGRMVAYGFLGFNEQPFRKDLCNLGLLVHQEYRGKGIGTLFVQKLIEEARKRNIRKIWISSYSENPRTVKFWLEQGFQIEGFLKDNENWDGELRSMVQMCIFLGQKPETV
jgi:RimJ/RimL family protein N-acetyltransferase